MAAPFCNITNFYSEDKAVLASITSYRDSDTYTARIYDDSGSYIIIKDFKTFKTENGARRWIMRNLPNNNDGRP